MRKSCLLGAVGVSLITLPALAQEKTPLESIYACADISDNIERLACFDAAVSATRQAENQGEFKTITRQEAETVQKDAFGFSMPSLPTFSLPGFGGGSDDDSVKKDDSGQIEEVTLPLKSATTDAYGKVVLVFENGQVWRQNDSDKIRISRKRPPTSAVIKRAAFGSYLIRLNTGERFKASREQ